MPSLSACILLCLLTIGVSAEPQEVAPSTDLREALADTTADRNRLLKQVERLDHQRSLLFVVAGLLAVAVGLLVRAKLVAGRAERKATTLVEESADIFPESNSDLVTATTVTMRKRKNATITIRNGTTQREEITSKEQTRRFFSGDTRKVARPTNTEETPQPQPVVVPTPPGKSTVAEPKVVTRTTKRTTTEVLELTPADAAESELRPSTDRVLRPTSSESVVGSQEGPRRPVTVRVDHQSDRLDVVEVTVKPGTTGVYRRQAFTLLEVMVSLALLATVLSSVISSIYTMHRARIMAQEDAESQALGRLFVERIMAEGWGNLHSSAAGSFWKANYADDPTAVPLTATALQNAGVVDQPPALDDLKVFIEYYPQAALETAIRNGQPMSFASRLGYRDRTMVFRIVMTWQGYDGGTRRHVQLFVRSE